MLLVLKDAFVLKDAVSAWQILVCGLLDTAAHAGCVGVQVLVFGCACCDHMLCYHMKRAGFVF
jgi:hypothetical protein